MTDPGQGGGLARRRLRPAGLWEEGRLRGTPLLLPRASAPVSRFLKLMSQNPRQLHFQQVELSGLGDRSSRKMLPAAQVQSELECLSVSQKRFAIGRLLAVRLAGAFGEAGGGR